MDCREGGASTTATAARCGPLKSWQNGSRSLLIASMSWLAVLPRRNVCPSRRVGSAGKLKTCLRLMRGEREHLKHEHVERGRAHEFAGRRSFEPVWRGISFLLNDATCRSLALILLRSVCFSLRSVAWYGKAGRETPASIAPESATAKRLRRPSWTAGAASVKQFQLNRLCAAR
jgi:hypothetical protein